MKLYQVMLLCENQYRYRAENFLKHIKDIYYVLRANLNKINSSLSIRSIEAQLPIITIYNELVVDRTLNNSRLAKISAHENYEFCILNYKFVLRDSDIEDINTNGTFSIIGDFDQRMNDIGINGNSNIRIDNNDCYINIGYIKDDLVKVVEDIIRHNRLDGMLSNNLKVFDEICNKLEINLPFIIKNSNQNVIQNCDVTVFNKNDFRRVVIDIGIVYKLFNYKDWSNCILPNKYRYEPTIYSRSGEEFFECIGTVILRGLNVPGKVVVKRLNDKEIIINIEILRSDLRGKQLTFDEGVL